MPPTLLSLRRHSLIGWLALLGAAIHVAGLVLADRRVVEYLKPTAPLYQLAGIAAAAILLALVSSSTTGVRRRLWASHRGFQATHVMLGSLLVALIAAHVAVTARYAGGRGRRALLAAAAIGALLMLLRRRRPIDPAHRQSAVRRRLVFGRHTTSVVGVLALSSLAVASLLPHAVDDALREPLFHRGNSIPLDFPHGKHGMVNCLICHHNYADGRGWGLCVQCHRSTERISRKASRRDSTAFAWIAIAIRRQRSNATARSPAAAPVINRPAPSSEATAHRVNAFDCLLCIAKFDTLRCKGGCAAPAARRFA